MARISRGVVVRIVCAGVLSMVALGGIAFARARGDAERVRWQPTMLVQMQVEDLDRSIDFYTKTLGFELESRNDAINWARIKIGVPGVTIGLGAAPDAKGSGTTSINLGVGDLEGARALLESRGVKFLGPTIKIPGVVQLADFYDPDGNKIRLAGHPEGFGKQD